MTQIKRITNVVGDLFAIGFLIAGLFATIGFIHPPQEIVNGGALYAIGLLWVRAS